MTSFSVDQGQRYLYSVKNTAGMVTGLLLKIKSSEMPRIKIMPHEKCSMEKVHFLKKKMSLDPCLKTPIMLGYSSNNPLFLLVKSISGVIMSEKKVNGCTHIVEKIPNDLNKKIDEILNQENAFLILDGHHRFEALKDHHGKRYFSMMVWIVPIENLQVSTFLKVFSFKKNCDFDFFITLLKNREVKKNIETEFIFFTSRNKMIKIGRKNKENDNDLEFIHQSILNLSQEEKVIDILHIPFISLFELKKTLHHVLKEGNKVLMIPKNMSEEFIKILLKNNQKLPVHSTYFHPKPLENLFFSSLKEEGR